MPANRPLERVASVLRDPWTLLTAGVAGGASWAIGLPVVGIGVVAVGSLAAAAGIAAAVKGSQDDSEPPLQPRTEQAELIESLDGHLTNLRRLTGQQLSAELAGAATEALAVAENSRVSALGVARAVDLLDTGLTNASSVRSYTAAGTKNVRGTVARMDKRRAALLDRLRDAVDQVGQIYTQLVEVSTTESTLDVAVGADGGGDVAAIGDSLTALQRTFTELEHDAEVIRSGTPI
jgi:hypothetical protein